MPRDFEHTTRSSYDHTINALNADSNSLIETTQKVTGKQIKDMVNEIKKETKREEKKLKLIEKKPIIKQRLVHLYISGMYSNKQISRMLNVAPSTINKWLKDKEVRAMIQMYQLEEKDIIDASLKSLRMRAVDTISDLLNDDNPMIALNAAKDILDRTGHKPEQKKNVQVNVSYEQRLNQIIEGAKITDVEYIDDEDLSSTEQNND